MRKILVENCYALDATELRVHLVLMRQKGYLRSERSGSDLNFALIQTGAEEYEVRVQLGTVQGVSLPLVVTYLLSTTPHFGGQRWWLRCFGCGRRCRILYFRPDGYTGGCRVCLQLSYASQQLDYKHRLMRKIERRKAQLGAYGRDTAVVAPIPPKPLRMRWTTYQRRVAELRTVENRLRATEMRWLAKYNVAWLRRRAG